MPEPSIYLLFTCEHASNRFPPAYGELERQAASVIRTHRAFDPGALELATLLANRFGAKLIRGAFSRLLVELNRSTGHPQLWSEFSRPLPAAKKQHILDRHYHPYRRQVEQELTRGIQATGRAMHISVHSFTPILRGQVRKADVGLLYDPSRYFEKIFCALWKKLLSKTAPRWIVRRNYPYLGKSDSLTSHLRGYFPGNRYLGIELEINQIFPLQRRNQWPELQSQLANTLSSCLMELGFARNNPWASNRPSRVHKSQRRIP